MNKRRIVVVLLLLNLVVVLGQIWPEGAPPVRAVGEHRVPDREPAVLRELISWKSRANE